MIGYLSGLIIDIDPDQKNLLLLTQGVGYKITVNNEVLCQAKKDQNLQLFIHTAVREDDISLYGFLTKAELIFFNQLISVSGVGPKMGLDILSSPVHLTQKAILSGNIGLLTEIKGVGKKTAERMILELKTKITLGSLHTTQESKGDYNEDAVLALESLGYEKFHIVTVLTQMPGDIKKTEEIVKYFLRQAI